MLRWFNPSHPPTLQAAVFLGYISGVFALLGTSGGAAANSLGLLFFLAAIAILAGAFGSANNKKIGWMALAAGSAVFALLSVWVVYRSALIGLNPALAAVNAAVFPVALFAAAVHAQTRVYVNAWFE